MCLCIIMYMYTCICKYVGVPVNICTWSVYVWVHEYVCLFVCSVACYSDSDPFGEIRTSYWRPGPDSGSCRSGPDTQEIRRSIHRMIRRSVPVRAVKTRCQFGSETTSFHVSVCFCLIFPIYRCLHVLCFTFIISCDFLLYFTSCITCIRSWDMYDCSF